MITAVWKKAGDALPGPLGSCFPRHGEGHPDRKRKLISLKLEFYDLGLDMAFLFPDTLDCIKRKIRCRVQILFSCTQNEI